MMNRIIGIGYIEPKALVWVSELERSENMGLPIRAFSFQLTGAASPYRAASHNQKPDGMWVATPTSPAVIEEAHMALVRAWESVAPV